MGYRALKLFISFALLITIVRTILIPDSPALTVASLMEFLSNAPQVGVPVIPGFTSSPELSSCMSGWQPIINFGVNIVNILNFIAVNTLNMVILVGYFFGYIFIV